MPTNFRVRRPLTPLEQALDQSGVTLESIAWKLAGRGATPTQKRSAEVTLRRALKNGGCTENYAQRVAHHLNATQTALHDLLLKPRRCWPRWALTEPRGDGEKTVSTL